MKLEAGLQSLRLCTDTDKSLFHSWSSSFAAGHFDGHQSVLPAPDHRVFHGMAHKLVSAMFFLMEEAKRVVAEMSGATLCGLACCAGRGFITLRRAKCTLV